MRVGTPEDAADYIAKLKQDVAAKGRDPDAYRIGALIPVLVHDDEAVLDRALNNSLVRWIGAIFGRTQPQEWRRHGEEPAVPDGWTYFMKMKPHDTPPAFVDEVVGKATRRMTELSYIWGNTNRSPLRSRHMSTLESIGCPRWITYRLSAIRARPAHRFHEPSRSARS